MFEQSYVAELDPPRRGSDKTLIGYTISFTAFGDKQTQILKRVLAMRAVREFAIAAGGTAVNGQWSSPTRAYHV